MLGDVSNEEERTPPQEWRQFGLVSEGKSPQLLVNVLMHAMDDVFVELEWALSVAAAEKEDLHDLYERIFGRFTHCAKLTRVVFQVVMCACRCGGVAARYAHAAEGLCRRRSHQVAHPRLQVCHQTGQARTASFIRRNFDGGFTFRQYAKHTKRPSARFVTLVDFIGANVSANVYVLLQHLADQEDEGTGRLKRESALHPNLVFVMEKLEAALIRINKSMAGINLMRNFVRTH